MGPDLLCLLCLGLCCTYGTGAQLVVSLSSHVAPVEEVTLRREAAMVIWSVSDSHSLEGRAQEPVQEKPDTHSQAKFSFKFLSVQISGIHLLCDGKAVCPVGTQGGPGDPGSLPRPTLHAEPGPVVRPGEKMLLWCRTPSESYDQLVTFLLLKAGTLEPLQKNQERAPLTGFPLKSASVQDSGSYSCKCYETSRPHVRSEASEALEVWVTDSLPKPSLSARPSSRVTSGDTVTLLCQGPSRGVEFALYKDGEEMPVSTREPTQYGAEFPLIHMNINQTGKYKCSYLLGHETCVLVVPSDPLELIIQEEQNGHLTRETQTILITALSCASILFFFFLFFTFRGHCHTQTVISHGDTSRRFPRCLSCTWFVCFSSKSGAPQDETEYAQVAKCRSSRTSVPEAEDPEGLTYIQLNPEALKKQQTAPGKMCSDPTTYTTLALQ